MSKQALMSLVIPALLGGQWRDVPMIQRPWQLTAPDGLRVVQSETESDIMIWHITHRCDLAASALADRHYNRQSPGAANFVPPGRCLVLRNQDATAVWVTSWPFAKYTHHAWAGAWVNSLFRKECDGLASDFIRDALAATRWYWPDVPALGMITFVDTRFVKHRRDPGRCYLKAGFRRVGITKVNRLLAFQLLPAQMPAPEAPHGAQSSLWSPSGAVDLGPLDGDRSGDERADDDER